ncbi:unnamed protein product [Spirodela intermedia]|uniref:1-phosphatidylinositol-3-phosphate 5-kinase n=1 Tax=Spirodela intermedia TaxID=51605 RepID=A0A7I8J4J4_SPIIN|nr:unnamed protein product [Spirodela intermedia]CAA6664291.1 unnamed protein product [Spirodela intermedia]
MPATEGIAEVEEPGGILCKDLPWRLSMICKFCSQATGLVEAVAEPEEGTESLASPQQRSSPPSLHCSTASFDDEEEEEEEEDGECPGKHFWSPCSIFSQDVSDVDPSSFSTGNEFYNFKCLTPSPLDSPNSYEPGKLDLLEQDPLDNLRSSERVTGDRVELACARDDKLIHFDSKAQEDSKPLDIENNDQLWLPPPPKDEGDDVENGYFEYDDEEDGVGRLDLFSTSSSFGVGDGDNVGNDEDDDDDDGGGGGFAIKERPNDAQKELLRTSVYGHFRALAANFVKPDTSRGASMDPADYVKVKCIPSGRPRESVLVKGVVCTKNVKHKRMISQHKNPRLLLLGGALEYQKVSNKLASLETVLQQEIDHLKMAVAKIEAHRPNVLLVEKSVSSYAQEYLLAKEISLVLNVKKPLLERISRCTGAQISPSVDSIASTRLGHCEVFRIERTIEEGLLGNQPGKKFSRTLMFFEGCPTRLGCTVLLRGPNRDELKKVKHILLYASFAAYHLSLETSFLADSGATLPKMPQNHPLDSPCGGDQQSILVSLSSSCVLKGIVCERSKLFRIKFYGNFDKPLGRYLRDDLFDQTSFCRCCREPPETHVRCFTHQQGSLTINVKRLLSAKLPGECDGRIWMWHRCLKCAQKDGVPPATQRVVMSDAAWGLSFGKFLELSFSNQAIANRVASCGHSLQKDCLRFFGFGSMVAFFHYSPVNILSVRLPPFVLEFASQSQQEWFRREIAIKVDLLYGEVLDVLRGIEQKVATYVDEPLKASLGNLLTELRDLVKNERQKYDVFLQSANLESFQLGHTSSDVLELNHLKRCLLIDSYVWDRRIYLLDSKVKGSSSEIDVHLLEVSIHNGLIQRSESFPIGRRADFSPTSSAKESEGVDLLTNPADCCAEPASTDLICDENSCNEQMGAIDSAWTGTWHSPNGSPLSDIDSSRKSTMTPVRVYSFDSSLVVRQRFHDLAPTLPLPMTGGHLGFGLLSTFPWGIENLKFLFGRMPLFISSANRMVRDGARLLLPQTGGRNVVIAVYDKEPSSVIAYALSSKEHSDFITSSLDQDETLEKDPTKDRWGHRGGAAASRSFELEDVQSQYYDSEEALFSQVSVYLEPKQPHFRFSFVDESSIPAEKARFSVTCYFAKEFDALRRKCCPNELDFICSLGRCRQWDAQGGKSNVYFAKSLDERFIIKQVTKTELESFEDFAPQYFRYLIESINSGSPTCLAKILESTRGREVRMDLMVMENLFFRRNISRVYDLKGSLRSRYNANTSLRTEPIFLGSKAKRSLERAIWNDTSFLATVDVMDYSLLVGIDEEKKELVLGIIDFLRQYTWDKHLETWVKASGILGGPMNASPTIISPSSTRRGSGRPCPLTSSQFLTSGSLREDHSQA